MGAAATAEAPAEPIAGQMELDPQFDDGPVGRLQKQAHDKDLLVEELEDAGDTEGADIARIEADALRSEARELAGKLGPVDPASKAEPEQGAGDPPEPDDAPAPLAEDIVVAGLEMEPIDFGGKKPTSGVLKFTGTSVKLMHGTFLKKGMVVKFSGTAVVNDVGGKDIIDTSTQQVTDAVQRHSAQIRSLSVEIPEAE